MCVAVAKSMILEKDYVFAESKHFADGIALTALFDVKGGLKFTVDIL